MPVVILVQAPKTYGVESHLGYGDMVFSFFSSISYHLEGLGKWGSRFPRLLLDLCDQGIVRNEYLEELELELEVISHELKNFSLSEAIYDIGDLNKKIPWKALPGSESHSLVQPWVTPRGEESYFSVFKTLIAQAKRINAPILLIYPPETADRNTLWLPKEKGRNYWIKDMGHNYG